MREESQADSPRLTGSIAEWFPLGQAEIALDESPETRQLVDAVAARLREARRAQRLTLRALSEKTGLSEPFLSRLERGRVSTSIANLILITRTVGIDLGQLFRGVSGTTTTQHYALVRAAERRPPQDVPATGYTYQPMAVGWPGQRMDAFVLTFPVKNRADVLTAHEGEELSFVLQGEILFQLGDEKIPLKTGDCLYFNAEIPHMGKNVGRVDAKVLMVAAPGRGPGREYGWWKAPAPAAKPKPRRARRSSRTRRDP
jgi:transcriptional regulator with XRE-family HTH domain